MLWSHVLGWGGLAFMLLLGPLIGLFLGSPILAVALAGVGLVSMITGAIIGQVGRAMQGRVI